MFICEKIVLVHIAKYHRKYITKDLCDHNENTLRCVCVCVKQWLISKERGEKSILTLKLP